MSHIEHRLAAIPITNHVMWNKINAVIKANPLLLRHSGAIELRCYQVDTDTWEHVTAPAQISRELAELIKWTPLGGDHFPEYLKNGKLTTPYFDHPSDPHFLPFYLEIDWLCRMTEVSHCLNFCEAEGSWYWEISSAAAIERFIGKNRSLSLACEAVLEHLFKINQDYLLKNRGLTREGTDAPTEMPQPRQRQYVGIKRGQKSFDPELLDRKIHRVYDIQIVFPDGNVAGDLHYVPVDNSSAKQMVRVETNNDRVIGFLTFDYIEKNIEWNLDQPMVGCYIEFRVDSTK
jgi:hypothetical protein